MAHKDDRKYRFIMTKTNPATWFLLGLNQREFHSLLPSNLITTAKADIHCVTPPDSDLSGEEWLLIHQFGLDWPLPYGGLLNSASSREHSQALGQWVHLKADQKQVFMLNSNDLEVSYNDSQALLASINELLDDDPFRLCMDKEGVIYARNPHEITVPKRSPASLMNMSVFDELRSLGRNAWAKTFSEIQMLLDDHAVNQQRRSRRQLPINALWLWGSSSQPQLPRNPEFQTICSDQIFWRRVAQWADLNFQPLNEHRVQAGQTCTLFAIQNAESVRQLIANDGFWRTVFNDTRPVYFILQDGHQYRGQRLSWWRRWLKKWGRK